MIKHINTIIFKEYIAFKKNWIFKLLNILGISFFLSIFFVLRVKLLENSNPVPIGLYILIIIAYNSFMQNLKLWQEKANKNLESILATSIPIKSFLIGKILFPLIVSIILILFNYIIMNVLSYLLLGQILLNFKILIYAVYISSIFNLCYGIITGYYMWCGSMLQAKFMQYITLLIYAGSLINTFIYKPDSINLKVINITLLFFIFISSIFLLKINKERTILNLLD